MAKGLAGQPATARNAGFGEELYNQCCATCHKVMGVGDGPLTEYMLNKVADLTELSANNDETFPMLRVVHIIDGRTSLRGHGGPMPTRGNIFKDQSEGMMARYGSVLETRGHILSRALYLESLQP